MYGVLIGDDGIPFAVSLQPDDKHLQPGEFTCKKDFYHKGGYPTFEIEVQGHTRVLFHIGNHEKDSQLCVLTAEAFEVINGVPGVAQSGKGFKEFWDKYKDVDEFLLIVTAKEGIL